MNQDQPKPDAVNHGHKKPTVAIYGDDACRCAQCKVRVLELYHEFIFRPLFRVYLKKQRAKCPPMADQMIADRYTAITVKSLERAGWN